MYEKRKNDGKFNERDFGASIQNNVRGTRVRKSGKHTTGRGNRIYRSIEMKNSRK